MCGLLLAAGHDTTNRRTVASALGPAGWQDDGGVSSRPPELQDGGVFASVQVAVEQSLGLSCRAGS